MGHRSLRKSAPAKPSRGAVALFAVPGGGKLDGQIKMAKSFGLMRPPFDSTRLVICALPDEVAGEIKPAAIPAEAHIAKVLPGIPRYVASGPHWRAMWIGLTESRGVGGTDQAAGC